MRCTLWSAHDWKVRAVTHYGSVSWPHTAILQVCTKCAEMQSINLVGTWNLADVQPWKPGSEVLTI
jgi:hypothetical protein